MRFRVRYSEFYGAGFKKFVPIDVQPQVRLFIDALLSRRPRDGSILWPPSSSKELRTDAVFVSAKLGYLRILFEMTDDEIVVWSISKGRLPDT